MGGSRSKKRKSTMWNSKSKKKKSSLSGIDENAAEQLFREIADEDDPNTASMEGKKVNSVSAILVVL